MSSPAERQPGDPATKRTTGCVFGLWSPPSRYSFDWRLWSPHTASLFDQRHNLKHTPIADLSSCQRKITRGNPMGCCLRLPRVAVVLYVSWCDALSMATMVSWMEPLTDLCPLQRISPSFYRYIFENRVSQVHPLYFVFYIILYIYLPRRHIDRKISWRPHTTTLD